MRLRTLSIIKIKANLKCVRCPFDADYSTTIVRYSLVSECMGRRVMNAFDGWEVICKGNSKIKMNILTRKLTVNADNMIDALGGVAVPKNAVKFAELREDMLLICSLLAKADSSSDAVLHITDRDLTADFDGYS